MEDRMAPPNKRRRLLNSISQSQPSHSDFVPEGPSPTLLHSVEHLNHKPVSTAARTVPQRIEEIHLQIQERAAVKNKGYHPLYLRQATAVETLITSINDQGQTITTEITVGATTTTPTPAASDTASTSSSSNHSSSTTSNLSDSGTTTGLGNSHNGTTTYATTKKNGSGTTTQLSSIYHATLTNGDVVTVTRSKDPYKTTFSDGEVSTICDRDDNCKLRTTGGAQSPDDTSPTSAPAYATTSTAYAAGGPTQGGPASPSSSAGAEVQHNDDNSSTPPPGIIAGGVVGGAAGLAVILLIAMILLRWYKRRKQLGHHALSTHSAFSPDPETPTSRGPGMAERAGIRPLAGAVPGFFKHQNRSDIEPPPSERSFQKISGRKLPSAYSEGMSSADVSGPSQSIPSVPSTGIPSTGHERNYSALSFYRDSQGFYGGEGDIHEQTVSADDAQHMQSNNSGVLLSPGPQRKPTVHTGGPYIMTPSSSVPSTPNTMQSPNLATIPGSPTEIPRAIQRSSTPSTVPDNRSSRFTEEV